MTSRLALLLALLTAPLTVLAGPWTKTIWQGEKAYAARSDSGNWVAIVSLERGRLVHLGATKDAADNLILATASKDDRLGWGGHRAWLGPQKDWAGGWPPPAAWEASGARGAFMRDREILLLTPPPTGVDGWPDLSRGYYWRGDSLQCAVAVRGPVKRDVQIVQIIQVPTDATIEVDVTPTKDAPQGYIQLPSYFREDYRYEFEPPAHVDYAADFAARAFRYIEGEPEKFGFKNRPITVRRNGVSLTMSRGDTLGSTVVDQPDHGYNTQVFFGGREAFVEIEQLSPLLRQTGSQFRSFSIELTPRRDR
ncbi:hypothetical protein [Actomonas aquatica]|uniref:Uncharacterized protein n=1 Tax=Actomonas aquatica TaxID=2866162 RepID=A0ABZ1C6X5_9BACT|nr:hypothetical protein [Opitutus sp. WL0086]WRQ86070.1 hypothetical protein K1X11_014745 [Opitutus sp. WL0086]